MMIDHIIFLTKPDGMFRLFVKNGIIEDADSRYAELIGHYVDPVMKHMIKNHEIYEFEIYSFKTAAA